MTAHVNGIGRKEKKKQDNERAVQKDRKKGNKILKNIRKEPGREKGRETGQRKLARADETEDKRKRWS